MNFTSTLPFDYGTWELVNTCIVGELKTREDVQYYVDIAELYDMVSDVVHIFGVPCDVTTNSPGAQIETWPGEQPIIVRTY